MVRSFHPTSANRQVFREPNEAYHADAPGWTCQGRITETPPARPRLTAQSADCPGGIWSRSPATTSWTDARPAAECLRSRPGLRPQPASDRESRRCPGRRRLASWYETTLTGMGQILPTAREWTTRGGRQRNRAHPRRPLPHLLPIANGAGVGGASHLRGMGSRDRFANSPWGAASELLRVERVDKLQ